MSPDTKPEGSGAERPLPGYAHKDPNDPRGGYVVISEWYDDYCKWCERNGEEPYTSRKFGKRLRQKIPDYDEKLGWKKLGGKMERVLYGIKLRGVADF